MVVGSGGTLTKENENVLPEGGDKNELQVPS